MKEKDLERAWKKMPPEGSLPRVDGVVRTETHDHNGLHWPLTGSQLEEFHQADQSPQPKADSKSPSRRRMTEADIQAAQSRIPRERDLPRFDGVVRTGEFDHNGLPIPEGAPFVPPDPPINPSRNKAAGRKP